LVVSKTIVSLHCKTITTNNNIMTTAKNNTEKIIALTESFLMGEITQDQFNTQVLILEKA